MDARVALSIEGRELTPRSRQKVTVADVTPSVSSPLPVDAPTVAVVVSLNFPDMTDEVNELVIRFTRTACEALNEAGAHTVLVDSSASPLPPMALVTNADGVLFLGGGDVDPTLYGVTGAVNNMYGVDRAADDYCISLINQCVLNDATVLAVCRGSQLLNLALGGTLIPDIEPWALHRGGPGKPMFLDEPITVREGTRLRDILGRQRLNVRSGHHQAVRDVAPALRVAAVADDGIVEATEHRDASWIVGVQWHPEDSNGSATDRALLFRAFVNQVKATRASQGEGEV